MLALILSSVAMATTMQAGEVQQASPVTKVVKMLRDMEKELQAEAKSDQEMFEKMSCWCETNNKEKSTAVEQAEASIRALEEDIKRRTARKEQLESAIAEAIKEQEQLQESLATAEATRQKEAEENHKAEVEYVTNIETLRGAILVLERHQAKAFPQLHLGFIEEFQAGGQQQKGITDDLDGLSKWMDNHHFKALDAKESEAVDRAATAFLKKQQKTFSGYTSEEVTELAKGKKVLQSLIQGKHAAAYYSKSGEIVGIMNQLLEELTGDLDTLRKTEAQHVADFNDLSTQLKEQMIAGAENLKRKKASSADNAKKLVEAEEDLEDTKASLDADTKFLLNLKEMCSKSDAEWEVRKATRNDELKAVSEAIAILAADDVKDTFTRTYSFVQVETAQVSGARAKASDVIARVAKNTHNPRLMALSTQVKLDAFTKVKAAINQMIETLKIEQGEEVKHKDFCTAEFHENELETMEKSKQQETTQALMDTLDNSVTSLTGELEATKKELEDLVSEQARANEDRIAENKAFQTTVADQRTTQVILHEALEKLAKFYNSFVQTNHRVKAVAVRKEAQQPPVKFEEYKPHGGASPVMTMLNELILDAKKLEKDAIADENSAQGAYETFVKDTNDSREAAEKAIVDKTEMKAEAQKQRVAAEQTLSTIVNQLADLDAYKGNLHKSCDFVLKNFDIRQGARSKEIESLKAAIGILSGAM